MRLPFCPLWERFLPVLPFLLPVGLSLPSFFLPPLPGRRFDFLFPFCPSVLSRRQVCLLLPLWEFHRPPARKLCFLPAPFPFRLRLPSEFPFLFPVAFFLPRPAFRPIRHRRFLSCRFRLPGFSSFSSSFSFSAFPQLPSRLLSLPFLPLRQCRPDTCRSSGWTRSVRAFAAPPAAHEPRAARRREFLC